MSIAACVSSGDEIDIDTSGVGTGRGAEDSKEALNSDGGRKSRVRWGSSRAVVDPYHQA